MTPETFPEANTIFAKDQPEYLSLEGYLDPKDRTGLVITRWKATWRERWLFLLTGRMWLRVLTFRKPLSPLRPQINSPFPDPDAHWSDPFWQLIADWKKNRDANRNEVAVD